MRRRTIVEATTVSSTPAPRVRAGSFASLRLARDGQAISVDRHGSLVKHDLRLRPARVGAAVVLERSQLASGCGFAADRSPLLALAIRTSGAPSRFTRAALVQREPPQSRPPLHECPQMEATPESAEPLASGVDSHATRSADFVCGHSCFERSPLRRLPLVLACSECPQMKATPKSAEQLA
jgi:hypothetical protein